MRMSNHATGKRRVSFTATTRRGMLTQGWSTVADIHRGYDRFIQIQARNIIRRYAPWLNDSDSDDITQQVYLKLIAGALKGYRGEAAVTTWLYHVIKSSVMDYARREGRFDHMQLPDERDELLPERHQGSGIVPEYDREDLSAAALRDRVDELLEGMPPVKSRMGRWYFLEGKKEMEIAHRSGRAVSTVSEHLSVVRRYLRHHLAGMVHIKAGMMIVEGIEKV